MPVPLLVFKFRNTALPSFLPSVAPIVQLAIYPSISNPIYLYSAICFVNLQCSQIMQPKSNADPFWLTFVLLVMPWRYKSYLPVRTRKLLDGTSQPIRNGTQRVSFYPMGLHWRHTVIHVVNKVLVTIGCGLNCGGVTAARPICYSHYHRVTAPPKVTAPATFLSVCREVDLSMYLFRWFDASHIRFVIDLRLCSRNRCPTASSWNLELTDHLHP